MTVITKPLSEKKADKLDQPLVAAECLPNRDVEMGRGVAGGDAPPQDPRILVLRARARRASSVTTACLLLMALLVMCCGILGGFYLYKQFAHSQSEIARWQQEFLNKKSLKEREQRMKEEMERNKLMHRLRGWCRIPYEQSEQGPFFEDYGKPYSEMRKADNHYLNEEFDIDGDSNSYEKINVPNFDGGRSSRFIHDFNANKTGIIDVEAHRCFVMPLNRSQVLPPRDLIDLVRKMWDGYYEVDTDTVRETMRVVLPPIKEPKTVGMYIERECAGYPIYKLEKIVSGVFKRSVSPKDPTLFTFYTGNFVQVKLTNEDELNAYELAHPRT